MTPPPTPVAAAPIPAIPPIPDTLGRDFVFVGSEPWDCAARTSKHHLARAVARRGGRVLYVENLSMRSLGSGGGRDAGKVLRGLRRAARGARPAADTPGVHALAPLYLPFPGSAAARAANRRLVAWQIRRAGARLGFDRPVFVYFVPTADMLRGMLGERLSAYYIVDNFAAFSDVAGDAVAALEDDALRGADAVFATAPSLADARRARRPDIRLALHGVDLEHFAAALSDATAIPPELAALPAGPRIGFTGTIDRDRMDFDLVAALARRRPDWRFVLVGRALAPMPGPFAGLANVHYLGERSYDDLPGWLKGFDIGLIPYVDSPLTRDVNPLKLREYLAAGLPVVATAIPATLAYAPPARCAAGGDVDGFEAAVAAQLGAGRPPAATLRAAVAAEGWDIRAEAFLAGLAEANIARREP